MADKNNALSLPDSLQVTVHEVLRYGYSGLLASLVAALVAPASMRTMLESLGTTLSVIVAFAVGSAIYIGHRPIVGELLYLLHEYVHVRISSAPVVTPVAAVTLYENGKCPYA